MGKNKYQSVVEFTRSVQTEKTRHVALLIGNGINRYKNELADSWSALLRKSLSDVEIELDWLTPKVLSEISLLQLFDLVANQFEGNENLQRRLKDAVSSRIRSWKPAVQHSLLVNTARKYSAPILTTNFDRTLVLADPEIERAHQIVEGRYKPHYYSREGKYPGWQFPWMCYFSNAKIVSPLDEFAIWHLHGTSEYKRSIRLGLEDYFSMAEKAKGWLYGGSKSLRKSEDSWYGSQSWMEPFFKSTLIIYGLGINREELFIRWLLIKRNAYLKDFDKRGMQSGVDTYYLCNKNELKGKDGRDKELFLNQVGVKIVLASSRRQLYETFPKVHLPKWLNSNLMRRK
ncbi:MAG TPA: hypothetical protein VK147_02840 [Candidatus Didemnitutus sp.]|nr:hypothetical protein [Candidatus Didemnitutus sp.]